MPVFEFCEVQSKVIVIKQKISLCLRVVAVGGDGIYNEVVSGLTVRELRDHGQDPDNPEYKLSQLNLPIGFIPAVSGKYTAWYRNGTECPVTAA
uniref:DAGKc domain-containing protein n=1 Tax=Magallana gigas TaxID=29159 RepID=A0A8W8I7W5_MAGGI